MPIKRRKISELEEAQDLTGFFTIGYRVLNGVKKSVKYGLEHIQTAYENMLKAMDEAKEATTEMRQLEATVQENEEERETAESRRDASEQGRCNEEEKRVEAENIRKIAESKRVEAESGRVTEEDARHNSELVRINAESLRVSQENTRKVTETNRVNVEATRVAEEGKRVIAEKGRVDAEAIRIAEFTTLKQNAETATSDANETANHPTYIGTDHYVYKWNKSTKAYDKMDIYCKGDAFSIKRVYSSIAALQADVNNMEVEIGDFVLVNTNNVEDPDNAKLYVKNKKVDGTYSYDFLVDMSGAIGFTGKTPQISIGTVSKGSNPVVTLSEDGVDGDANPKYKLNLVLPQGEKGEAPVLEVGTITTGASGSQASATLDPNGSTSTGAPKYRLNMTIPQGLQGAGNMQVSVSGLVAGKTYLFKPSANNSAVGSLVEFSQAQADWDVTDTSLPSFIKNKPSSFTPSAHKHKKSEITDFPTSMPASDVYDWAKQQNKPSYTALEVGALPSAGTAVAADKLANARKINGIDFDGTKDIILANVGDSIHIQYENMPKGVQTADLSNLDSNWYYPVLLESKYSSMMQTFGVHVNLDTNVPAWATHQSGFSCNCEIKARGGQWGTNGAPITVTEYNVGWFSGYRPLGYINQFQNTNDIAFYLRGGGVYKLYNNNGATINIIQNSISVAGQTIEPLLCSSVSGSTDTANGINDTPTAVGHSCLVVNQIVCTNAKLNGTMSSGILYIDASRAPNNNHDEGIRITDSTGGWSTISIGTKAGEFKGTHETQWNVCKGPTGDFYIDRNALSVTGANGFMIPKNGGGIHCSTGFYKDSDIRLKSDIKPLSHTLEQILSIPTTSFKMNAKKRIGTIAQELEKICPELVSEITKRKDSVPENINWEVIIIEEGGKQVEYVKVKSVEYEMISILVLEGLKLLNRKFENLRNELLNK